MTLRRLFCLITIYLCLVSVHSKIDWSTRDKAQIWFNNFGKTFEGIVKSGESISNLMIDYADDVIDCNSRGCYDNKQELINDLDDALKLLSSFGAHFDIAIWSKKQVQSNVIYIHQGINGKELVFRASLLSKLNDNGQISHWIYTADEEMLQQTHKFWEDLSKQEL